MGKRKKERIELMTTCSGWERGYTTKILSHDDDHYYFNDVRGCFSNIEKNKEGVEFIIVGKIYLKEAGYMCGGKDITYNKLMKKAAEYRNQTK